MLQYQLLEVVDPTLTADAVKAHGERVDDLIKKNGGEILVRHEPNRRRIGHKMRKHGDGVLMVAEFTAPSSSLKEVTRVLNLDRETLRHMVTRKDPVKPKAPRAKAPKAAV